MSHKCNNCYRGVDMTTKQILKAHGMIPNNAQYRQMLGIGFISLWVLIAVLLLSLV